MDLSGLLPSEIHSVPFKTRKHVEQITNVADAAIIGSEVVNTISNSLDADGKAQPKTVQTTLSLVRKLASGVRGKQNL